MKSVECLKLWKYSSSILKDLLNTWNVPSLVVSSLYKSNVLMFASVLGTRKQFFFRGGDWGNLNNWIKCTLESYIMFPTALDSSCALFYTQLQSHSYKMWTMYQALTFDAYVLRCLACLNDLANCMLFRSNRAMAQIPVLWFQTN